MKRLLFVLFTLTMIINAHSQDGENCPCCNEETRALNFLLGEWEFVDLEGNKISTSSIASRHDSCVIHEEWALVDGSMSGLTTIHYDYQKQEWRCIILDNLGSSIDFRAAWADTTLYLLNDQEFDSKGAEITFQIFYTPKEDGSISYINRYTNDDHEKDIDPEWKTLLSGTYLPITLINDDTEVESTASDKEKAKDSDKKKKKR